MLSRNLRYTGRNQIYRGANQRIIKILHNLYHILFTLIVSQAQRHGVGLNGCDHPFSVGDMKRCDQV